MSHRFWRHFLTNGHSHRIDRLLGLFGGRRRMELPGSGSFPENQTEGFWVRTVDPFSPAEEAGLLEGDLLLSLAGQPTGSLKDLNRLLAHLPLGRPLAVVLLRRGQLLERWVVLGDFRKSQFPHV